MVQIHHVNLGIPPGRRRGGRVPPRRRLPAAAGARGIPDREVVRGDDGSQVHLSEDPEHRPGARAHVAVVLGDELDEVVERLRAHGTEADIGGFGDVRVAICLDPAGNRWELGLLSGFRASPTRPRRGSNSDSILEWRSTPLLLVSWSGATTSG